MGKILVLIYPYSMDLANFLKFFMPLSKDISKTIYSHNTG
jgi:hypothetical protein